MSHRCLSYTYKNMLGGVSDFIWWSQQQKDFVDQYFISASDKTCKCNNSQGLVEWRETSLSQRGGKESVIFIIIFIFIFIFIMVSGWNCWILSVFKLAVVCDGQTAAFTQNYLLSIWLFHIPHRTLQPEMTLNQTPSHMGQSDSFSAGSQLVTARGFLLVRPRFYHHLTPPTGFDWQVMWLQNFESPL